MGHIAGEVFTHIWDTTKVLNGSNIACSTEQTGPRTVKQQTTTGVGTGPEYTRWTREIDADGVASAETSQVVTKGTSGLVTICNICGSAQMQFMSQQQAGSSEATRAWVTNGVRGSTVDPAYTGGESSLSGTNKVTKDTLYLPGRGVYLEQYGSTGFTSRGIGLYPAATSSTPPSRSVSHKMSLANNATIRFLGSDGDENIYFMQNGTLYCYTWDLTPVYSFTEANPQGGSWGSMQDVVVMGNGNIIIVSDAARSIYAYELSASGIGSLLGSQEITAVNLEHSHAYPIGDNKVVYQNIPALWSIGLGSESEPYSSAFHDDFFTSQQQ